METKPLKMCSRKNAQNLFIRQFMKKNCFTVVVAVATVTPLVEHSKEGPF